MPHPRATQLTHLVDVLQRGLVERGHCVRLCLLAALAGEHTLLIGPPGTAKSELARRLHTAFKEGHYFERLLTRFTVPEELFGPLSIQALEEDRYERHTEGFLPSASIAFIDEVFKANSAILNALLTLLNEREFDNGAGRMRCPLISVLGATNSVPEDEIADAFFDRFLLRLPVTPVSADGFSALLEVDSAHAWTAPAEPLRFGPGDLHLLAEDASHVQLPTAVVSMLGSLRKHFAALSFLVSDRRWVKIVWLLRVAAASEGRDTVELWDLLLLPWLSAPDATRQAEVANWLTARLGVREAFSPARLTRVVEAFERQLDVEQQANDLDYDESGRLNFSATDIASEIGDAKGGSAALRMNYNRRRRYGDAHINARVQQLDSLLLRIADYAVEAETQLADLKRFAAGSLWLDPASITSADCNLTTTAACVQVLFQRAQGLRNGFMALPRLSQDSGAVPEPVDCEPLDAV